MSSTTEVGKCLICSTKHKTMVSLQQSLIECDELSVFQILLNLKFLTISDSANYLRHGERKICFICVSTLQSCFQLKKLCFQIKNHARHVSSTVNESKSISILPFINLMKLEKNRENETIKTYEKEQIENYDFKKQYKSFGNSNEMKAEENTLNFTEVIRHLPIATNFSIMRNIEIDEGTFEVKKEQFLLPQISIVNDAEHTAGGTFSCPVCRKVYKRQTGLEKHFLVHTNKNPYVCKICDKSFLQSSRLNIHKIIHTGERPYVCSICDKSFCRKDKLARHHLIHTGERPHICNVCYKAFNRRDKLIRHQLMHTGERPHVCNICYKSFYRKDKLVTHQLTHTDEKPHACDICSKSFLRKDNLNTHKLSHNKKKILVQSKRPPEPDNWGNLYN